MIVNNENLIGVLLTVYMKSGNVYSGATREISDKRIILANPSGKYYHITNMSEVECFSYDISENKVVSEKNPKDEIPQHAAGDIKSLVELKKMKANEDLQAIRKQLKADQCIQKQVSYASTISALNAVKKHTGE